MVGKQPGRRTQGNAGVEVVSGMERLRRSMSSKHPKPANFVYVATCNAKKAHSLLWVAVIDGRLVPVARVSRKRGMTPSLVSDNTGNPYGLRDWPAGMPVPVGVCSCGVRTRFTADELLHKVTHGIKSERIPKVPTQRARMS